MTAASRPQRRPNILLTVEVLTPVVMASSNQLVGIVLL